MKSGTKLMMASILIIAILAVPVVAMTITGDATVSNSDQTSSTENSVTIEKHVDAELQNNAQVKDATSNGPMGPATSGDGTITVSLNADITASGKTTGTGSAILNGSVVAQGSHDPGNTTAVINTTVSSSVVLDSGTKGTAEGKVFSSGNASATFDDGCKELTSDVVGSSSASGKTKSASVGLLNASSGIWSESAFDPLNTSAEALIYSYIYGENTSSGSACASGNASATADNGNVIADVAGETKASGSGSGSGGFDANAEISAESEVGQSVWGYVESIIYSDSSVWNGCGKYTGTASSSASTPIGENTAYYVGGPSLTNVLGANTTGTAKSDAAMTNGMGIAYSQSGILASAAAPSTISPVLEFGPKSLGLGFVFIPVYEDRSLIWNDVFTSGNGDKSKVSASGWTGGEADAMLAYSTPAGFPMTGVYTSNTSAEGDTSAKAKVEGCGVAGADSLIGSFDLIGVDGYGSVFLWEGIPGGDNFELPDTTALTDNQGFDALQIPALDINGYLPSDTSFVDQLQGPIIFELPPVDVLEISIISQSVYAESGYKSKASAGACADGETAAEGVSFLTEPIGILAQGNSSASGFVAGGAEASSPKKDTADPESASVILGVSAQGIGIPFTDYTTTQDGNEISGLDATLIASTSGASGPSGKTWGVASGDANAAGGFGSEIATGDGPSSSSGTAESSATANCGLALSAAAIGSADYATDELYINTIEGFELDPSLVDVALIGTGAFSAGTAGAHASAHGQTEANGSILHEFLVGDPITETALNITSDAYANGMACSDVQTKNGLALAADMILAGESSGAEEGGLSGGGGSGTAGSMVGQAAFAQQFGKSGSAKATTFADGAAGTSSTFYYDLGGIDLDDGAPQYISGQGITGALGEVKGSANAGCGDPLSASAIVAYTEFGGGGSTIEGFNGGGETYDAALIASLSASHGKSADTWGSADGISFADSSLEVNTSPEIDSVYQWHTNSTADAKVKTTASTKSNDGFALGLAAQGSSSEIEASIGEEAGSGSEHAITLDGALSVAAGDGKATADVNKIEQICKDKKGKTQLIVVPILTREATALAQFTGDINDDTEPEINLTSTSYSGSTASSAAEAAKGGFALALGGEASGALTDISAIPNGQAVDYVVPEADQDVFSVIADLAIGETDCKKETAKAVASAEGDTNAFSYGQIPNWNGTQFSSAVGSVSANAIGGDICKDPLSASIILALGDNDAYPDPSAPQYAGMNVSDTTLIGSLALTNGTKGDTGATACGSANANGVQLVPEYTTSTLTPLSPTASASTEASVWSHASGNNGMGLGVAGVGSTSFAHAGYDNENVSDQNLMFSYTEAQGFGKKATADAGAGYDAAHTAAAASNVFDRDLETAKASSTSSISGKGQSSVQASDWSKAQALSFGWAGQDAWIDWNVPAANGSHAEAMVLFGTEANATNDAKGTIAKADICQAYLAANATAGFEDQYNIPVENASAGVNDGSSYVFIDPDGGPTKNGFIDLDTKNTVGTYEASVNTVYGSYTYGRFIKASTATDPNYGYTHGGAWANSDVGTPPSPFPPEDYILPMIPV
jgi:hypothetical protein